ncbi:glycoside hydrolase [Zopfochytrium polystomum]|nr:glycoside hydrolase [Zopfochytrium polystomum]
MHVLPVLAAVLVSTLLASLSPAAVAAAPCVVTSFHALKKCLTSTNIVLQGPFIVPSNHKIDMSSLKKGTHVTVKGLIKFAHSTKLTKSDYLFTLGGESIIFDGKEGTFHGNGQQYWDTKGTNGGNKKPKFIKVRTTGQSVIKGLTIKNSPAHTFSITGSDTTLKRITIDNSDGDKQKGGKAVGHNTDGFDVSGKHITIKDSTIKNQDDCLSVASGHHIYFLNNTCTGGNGISVGSIASHKSVSHIRVENCTVADSDIGIRIKTIAEAEDGKVEDVHFKDIVLKDIRKRGVSIRQDYLNAGPTMTPTDGIPISNVRLTNVQGTMAKGAKHSTFVLCAACDGFKFTNVKITGATPSCTGVEKTLVGCT